MSYNYNYKVIERWDGGEFAKALEVYNNYWEILEIKIQTFEIEYRPGESEFQTQYIAVLRKNSRISW